MSSTTSDLDVCIIGAGPAGLAVARVLRAFGIGYTHFERHHGPGGIWDITNPGGPMYSSAHFISSKTMSGFSAFPMPEHYPDYPNHKQIHAYLTDFAAHYGLTPRIEFNREVTAVSSPDAGRWQVTSRPTNSAKERTTSHSAVVVCTGSQWHPRLAQLPGNFAGQVRHSQSFKHAEEFQGQRVLVVGGGNSACDIACDAARTADEAHISMRRGYWMIPKHIFGMPVDVFADGGPPLPKWLEQRVFGAMLRMLNGDPARLGLPRPDHKLFETHPVINSQLLHYLQHGDITAHSGIRDIQDQTVFFEDGTQAEVDLILLATGYEHRVPVAQEYFGDADHPDLYLSSFSREHEGLFGVGFVETNSGAYQIFDMQAHLIGNYLNAQRRGTASAAHFAELIASDDTDLTGGLRLVDSARHKGYVDSTAITHHLQRVAREMGWPISLEGYRGTF